MKKMIVYNGPAHHVADRDDDGNPVKGILIGLAVSIPLWACLGMLLAAFGG